MRKVSSSIILLFLLFFPVTIKAAGNITVSPSAITIEQGESVSFNIVAVNTIGDVSILSSNTSIATVSTSSWETGMVEVNQTKKGSINVKGVSIGSTTIVLKLDAATFDSEDLSGQTRIVNVTVKARSSRNNNIKELNVEGYDLIKVDNNNYTLTVNSDVESININGTAEDSKSTIVGLGLKNLSVGDNVFEITVTSESGASNVFYVKVTRKDGYYLMDLEEVLDNAKSKEIIINYDDVLSEDQIKKIKSSKKSVELSYYNSDKLKVYSWILNGAKISDTSSFNTKVVLESNYIDEIKKESNYAEGINVSFAHNGKFPESAVAKIYVGNNFENKDNVNLYYYDLNTKKLVFISDAEVNKEGYIEYPVNEHSDIFITKAELNKVSRNLKFNENKKNGNLVVFIILEIVQIGIIVFLVVLFLKTKKNNKVISVSSDNNVEVLGVANNVEKNTYSTVSSPVPVQSASEDFVTVPVQDVSEQSVSSSNTVAPVTSVSQPQVQPVGVSVVQPVVNQTNQINK